MKCQWETKEENCIFLETTLLEAVVQLYNHKKKKEELSFTIYFDGVTRTCVIGKHWVPVMKKWIYFI